MFDKIIAKYFLFEGRLNRKPYLMINFVHLPLATLIIPGIFYIFFPKTFYSLFLNFWSIVILVVSFSITFRRLHDLGYSKLSYLWLLIPIINIYWAYKLFFVRGTYGDNEYGHDPLLSLDKY